MKETDRRVRTAVNQAVHYRNYRRVRDRALRRLAHRYPDDYRTLLEEERARDEAEGKAWLDISGTTRDDAGIYLPPHRQDSSYRSGQTNADEQNQSNVGAEE